MARGVVVGATLVVVFAGLAVGGLWWQSQRSAAKTRERLLAVVESELTREPLDRGNLVQVDRDLKALREKDPAPDLARARARIALALRLPDDAISALDDVAFAGRAETLDLPLRARALAMRHALGGRLDDAHAAAARALEHFDAAHDPASALLAWQCATRSGDSDISAAAAARLATVADSWQHKVVQALLAFDPSNAASVETLRQLQLEVPPVPELDVALAAVDLASADEIVRTRGIDTVKRVLHEVPSSKPARLVAIVACDQAGDVVGRRAHLEWLIANFPRDDGAETWRRVLLEK
jgi:hypothetical protein